MIPAGSEKARKMFPELEKMITSNDLAVISDDGEVYLNSSAWIMALYALEEYREWACRLAHPMIAPFARQAFEMISRNRHTISIWLGHDRPEEIAGELKKVPLPPCAVPNGTVSDYLR